jgi:hypothetical protein
MTLIHKLQTHQLYLDLELQGRKSQQPSNL